MLLFQLAAFRCQDWKSFPSVSYRCFSVDDFQQFNTIFSYVTWGCQSFSLLSHSVVSNEQKQKTSLPSWKILASDPPQQPFSSLTSLPSS
ncbi:hypothetical protein Bca101_020205 [Brassica carinata]